MQTIEQYEFIGVVYGKYLDSVKDMIVQHYNNKAYSGCLFLVNGFYDKAFCDSMRGLGYTKLILYNLEHIYIRGLGVCSDTDSWWGENCIGWTSFEFVDECWDFLLENKKCYGKYEYKYRFMPLRYYETNESANNNNAKYDVLFCGVADTDCRKSFLNILTKPEQFGWYAKEEYKVSFLFSYGYGVNEMKSVLDASRFVIDYPHYSAEHNEQNCVRIFELLCRNRNVISCMNTKTKVNYFGDLVKVLHIDECILLNYYDLCNYVNTAKNFDVADGYKALTYSDNMYEAYKTKLELMYNDLCK